MPEKQRMLTIAQSLAADAESIKEDIRVLLGQYSRLLPQRRYEGIVFIDPDGNHNWQELSVEGKRLQAKVLKRYKTYRDLVEALLQGLTDDTRSKFTEADELITKHVEQQKSTWCETADEATTTTMAAFNTIASIIDGLYSPDGTTVAVPDTNALLANPEISRWHFDWCKSFEVVFTPTVLAELDELKISHRNPDVRTKAEGIIRQIKELGRRGDLHAGIPVVKGRITARCVAIEPDVSKSLPWLDEATNDDRLLAAVIDLTRENTRCVVVIVTGDINLQNKARFARLPFCEPPAPGGNQSQPEDACQ